jgi:hypothetical protein
MFRTSIVAGLQYFNDCKHTIVMLVFTEFLADITLTRSFLLIYTEIQRRKHDERGGNVSRVTIVIVG